MAIRIDESRFHGSSSILGLSYSRIPKPRRQSAKDRSRDSNLNEPTVSLNARTQSVLLTISSEVLSYQAITPIRGLWHGLRRGPSARGKVLRGVFFQISVTDKSRRHAKADAGTHLPA